MATSDLTYGHLRPCFRLDMPNVRSKSKIGVPNYRLAYQIIVACQRLLAAGATSGQALLNVRDQTGGEAEPTVVSSRKHCPEKPGGRPRRAKTATAGVADTKREAPVGGGAAMAPKRSRQAASARKRSRRHEPAAQGLQCEGAARRASGAGRWWRLESACSDVPVLGLLTCRFRHSSLCRISGLN